jgi:hypothetical protein
VTVGISGEKFSGSFTVQGGKCLRKDKWQITGLK